MYLQRHLERGVPKNIRSLGEILHESRAVRLLSGNQWQVSARVSGSRVYEVELSRDGVSINAECDCPYSAAEGLCKHIWAAILAADSKNYLLGNIGGAPPRLVLNGFGGDSREILDDFLDDFDIDIDRDSRARAFRRGAPLRRVPTKPSLPHWRQMLNRVANVPHYAERDPEWPASRALYYVVDATQTLASGDVHLEVMMRDLKQNGEWGVAKSKRIPRSVIPTLADPADRDALLQLSGVPGTWNYQEAADFTYRLRGGLAQLLLPRLCLTGRCLMRPSPTIPFDAWTPLAWDDGPAWRFRLAIEERAGKWMVRGALARENERLDLAEPLVLLASGVLLLAGSIARLDHGGAFPWISLLRADGPIEVPAAQGDDLVAELLRLDQLPDVDWPKGLSFETIANTPRPCLKVRESGSFHWRRKELLTGELSFDYAGAAIHAGAALAGIYDAAKRQYYVRDPAAEQSAAAQLQATGWKPAAAISAAGFDWQLPPKKLPQSLQALVKSGWGLDVKGKTFRNATGFRAELVSGIDWFELRGGVEFGDATFALPELLRAIERGEQLAPLSDGSFGILPDEIVQKYGTLVRFARGGGESLRFSRSQVGLLDVLLAERPEVQVDRVFEKARTALRAFDGILPSEQPAGFRGELRGYQKEGVGWMHFLRDFAFGGCLADDMGVGKTPQVLALLETRRERRVAGEALPPSLAVVPRSLVYNWKLEAARFTPQLRLLDHTGTGRAKNGETFAGYDVIVTTYGTLRRDAAEFKDIPFDYVILDEAQAIKNAQSESAKAARLLQANHRLAMSGTPIENHLGELWSLFEFLNPGMLGAATVFQHSSGALRNPDDATRDILARSLRPFILRRTKEQVASELPPKQEQTIYCELDPVQRKLYDELRDHFRDSLLQRIDTQGMAKSKMHVLEALLRLRQAACHPGLIDKKRTADESAKLDVLLPRLAEICGEGHKALVFSQFTSFLAILRAQLDKDGVVYEYLDGRTRDRQSRVERFQSDPDCKLFLVSLKAGGVGLNLTAADYVFLLDPWWNPAVESQAIDRTHRIGQTRHVFAYRLIARNTVEEKVLELQTAKRGLADAILAGDSRTLRDLRREDLELLLS